MNFGITFLVLGLMGIFLGAIGIFVNSMENKPTIKWLHLLIGASIVTAIAAGILAA